LVVAVNCRADRGTGRPRPRRDIRAAKLELQKADKQNTSLQEPVLVRRPWTISMKAIRNYSTQVEADLARIALEGADIPAVVVGVGIGMKGGVLLVPEDRIEAALKVLKDFEECA
jgi:hypothetical protein